MADSGIMIDKDGKRTTVRAVDVKPEDRYNHFYCLGDPDKGIQCGIPMRISFGSIRQKPHLYPASKSIRHARGCPYDHSQKAMLIQQLDRTGHGKTAHDLYTKICKSHQSRKYSHNSSTSATPFYTEEEMLVQHTIDDSCDKPIKIRSRLPNTVHEYYNLLQYLSIYDNYLGQRVFDLILDERTIDSYRRMKIPCRYPFLVIARRTFPYEHPISLRNDQWILVDFWAVDQKRRYPIVFLLNVTPAAKAKLVTLCRKEPSVPIAVLSVFHAHPNLPRTYVSNDLIDVSCIAELNDL